jgi:O-antigen/teichoic acid export membrane protein
MQQARFSRNFIMMFSGNTISQVIPFISAPFLAYFFTVEEFGDFSNFIALVSTIGIIATGRLEMAITQPKDDLEAQKVVFTGLCISIILSLLCFCLFFFKIEIENFYKSKFLSEHIWLVPISVFSFGLLGLFSNITLRTKQFKTLSIGKITQSILNSSISILLGYLFFGVYGLILGWILSQYTHIIYLFLKSRKLFLIEIFQFSEIKLILKKYKDFPLINSLHAFTDIFATQFLLFWMIVFYFGKIELGLFAMMFKYVKAPIVLVTSSVSQLFFVEATNFKNNQQDIYPLLLKTIKTTSLFAFPFVFIIWFFAPLIFKWYLGPNWEQAGNYAVYLLPLFFMTFFTSPISGIPIIFNKQKTAFVFSFFGYSLSILSIYFSHLFHFDFSLSLIFYGLSFTLYYLSLFIWYIKLVRKHDAGIN